MRGTGLPGIRYILLFSHDRIFEFGCSNRSSRQVEKGYFDVGGKVGGEAEQQQQEPEPQ